MLRREKIMQMLADGVPYSDIAREFQTTVGTIRVYDLERTGRLTTSDLAEEHEGHEAPVERIPLSKTEIDKIRELREQGISIGTIGKMLHRGSRMIRPAIKSLGVKTPKQERRIVQEEYRDRIIEAHSNGVGGPVQIARKLGVVTPAMVNNVLIEYVYPRNASEGKNNEKR